MPPAVLASFHAWIAAIAGVFLGYFFILEGPKGNFQPDENLIAGALIYLMAIAIVVFSTCLLIVTPLLRFLPSSSKLWNPRRAAAVGAGVGLFAISLVLWGMFSLNSAEKISAALFFSPIILVHEFAASLAGATFGFRYAKLRQKTTGA